MMGTVTSLLTIRTFCCIAEETLHLCNLLISFIIDSLNWDFPIKVLSSDFGLWCWCVVLPTHFINQSRDSISRNILIQKSHACCFENGLEVSQLRVTPFTDLFLHLESYVFLLQDIWNLIEVSLSLDLNVKLEPERGNRRRKSSCNNFFWFCILMTAWLLEFYASLCTMFEVNL